MSEGGILLAMRHATRLTPLIPLALALACGASSSPPRDAQEQDDSPPVITGLFPPGWLVLVGNDIEVTVIARDSESGIRSVTIGDTSAERAIESENDWSATVPFGEYVVTVTNGAGLVTTRSLSIAGNPTLYRNIRSLTTGDTGTLYAVADYEDSGNFACDVVAVDSVTGALSIVAGYRKGQGDLFYDCNVVGMSFVDGMLYLGLRRSQWLDVFAVDVGTGDREVVGECDFGPAGPELSNPYPGASAFVAVGASEFYAVAGRGWFRCAGPRGEPLVLLPDSVHGRYTDGLAKLTFDPANNRVLIPVPRASQLVAVTLDDSTLSILADVPYVADSMIYQSDIYVADDQGRLFRIAEGQVLETIGDVSPRRLTRGMAVCDASGTRICAADGLLYASSFVNGAWSPSRIPNEYSVGPMASVLRSYWTRVMGDDDLGSIFVTDGLELRRVQVGSGAISTVGVFPNDEIKVSMGGTLIVRNGDSLGVSHLDNPLPPVPLPIVAHSFGLAEAGTRLDDEAILYIDEATPGGNLRMHGLVSGTDVLIVPAANLDDVAVATDGTAYVIFDRYNAYTSSRIPVFARNTVGSVGLERLGESDLSDVSKLEVDSRNGELFYAGYGVCRFDLTTKEEICGIPANVGPDGHFAPGPFAGSLLVVDPDLGESLLLTSRKGSRSLQILSR